MVLDILALVGSGAAAIIGVIAAQLSRKYRSERLREAEKKAKKVTVKVDGQTYTVHAPPDEINKFIGAR